MISTLCTHNHQLLSKLLDLDYCNQELVNAMHPEDGTILNMVAKYDSPFLETVLNHKFMNNELFKNSLQSSYTNILFQTCGNPDLFALVCNSKYYDANMVTHRVNGNTILHELLQTN